MAPKSIFPIFFENSKVPVILSKVAPIEIGAINLGPFVFSRGLISETTKRHETIHYKQQLELLFVFFYLLYVFFWLKSVLSGVKGRHAYYDIPFEKEAYQNQNNFKYLNDRKTHAWRNYL